MVSRLTEWLEQCDTLQTSAVMTDEEIVHSVCYPNEAVPLEDELAGDQSRVEGEIELIDEVPAVDKNLSREEVVEHLENLFSELSVKQWFNDNESLVLANLIRKANEDIFLSKKQGKLTSYYSYRS